MDKLGGVGEGGVGGGVDGLVWVSGESLVLARLREAIILFAARGMLTKLSTISWSQVGDRCWSFFGVMVGSCCWSQVDALVGVS